MGNSVLYKNIIDATKKIVAQFGKDILHEERFVNVLSDLSPGRNEPAVFKIIRSAIQDDLLKSILNADVKSIEHYVATATSALSKQYGYDQSLVEGLLFSLAIGYGTITNVQYNAIKAFKNKPVKKQTAPSSQNNNNKKQKSTNNTTNPSKKKIDFTIIKFVLALLWGTIGLTVSPLLYLLGVGNSDGICFVGTFYIAILHLFTLVPIAAVINGHPSLGSPKTYPSLAGAMYGLILCAIIFWVVFPILFGFQFILDIWGINIKEPFPWITTIFANLFCAGILCSYLEDIEHFSGIPTNNKIGSLSINRHLFKSNPFKKGFIIVVSYFLLVGFIALIAPTVSEVIDKYRIERINSYIDDVNNQKKELRKEREKAVRNLSFAQFSLDDNFSQTVTKIGKEDTFTIESASNDDESLFIYEDNYISIIDSIIRLETHWNNELIKIDMFFVKDNLAALRYSPVYTVGDSILSMYTAKYGEPEYELHKYEYLGNIMFVDDFRNISSGNINRDELFPDSYYWTYKNALIKIDYNRYNYSYLYDNRVRATITYFNRKVEPILKKKKKIEDEIQKEIDRKRNDSIKREFEIRKRMQEETNRRLEKQKRQEELNHQRSMEQI